MYVKRPTDPRDPDFRAGDWMMGHWAFMGRINSLINLLLFLILTALRVHFAISSGGRRIDGAQKTKHTSDWKGTPKTLAIPPPGPFTYMLESVETWIRYSGDILVLGSFFRIRLCHEKRGRVPLE